MECLSGIDCLIRFDFPNQARGLVSASIKLGFQGGMGEYLDAHPHSEGAFSRRWQDSQARIKPETSGSCLNLRSL